MAEARKERYSAVKGLAALSQQRQFRRVEICSGMGGGEVAESSPARKAHGRPADPHVDHKRLAASFPNFSSYTR